MYHEFVLHDYLPSGCLAVCIKHLLIFYITVEKLFPLQQLNQRIHGFSFGSSECKNRPSEIANHHLRLSGELKQSGQLYIICSV